MIGIRWRAINRSFVASLAIAVVLPVSSLPSVSLAAESTADPFGEHTPIMVVLDTSGSMDEVLGDVVSTGGSRLDSAQSALLDLVGALGPDQPYGMIAYPGRDSITVDGCETGRLETALAPLSAATASAEIRRMTPDGETPTGPALLHASQELTISYGEGASGVIVLVSDGESNCGPPPCEVAKEIRAGGIDVQVNTVGLELDGEGEDELRCIADATGGRYIAADNSDELIDAITGAALGRLTMSVSAPDDFVVVSGTGTSAGSTVTVEVTSNGRVAAADVRVSLSITLDSPGSVLVPRPVRFLGNLETGDVRRLSFEVRPDDSEYGTAEWTVTVTSRNARPQTASGSALISGAFGDLGPLLQGVERVVVLGDSYSSGEGTEVDYISGTDGGANESACHRSERTYASILWDFKNVNLIACAGAVTRNFYEPQRSGDVDVIPQLTLLREAALSDKPPEAVLLSIGGNDVGFADVAKRCIYGATSITPLGSLNGSECHRVGLADWKGPVDYRTSSIERALDVKADIIDVLRAVDSAVNDAEALRNRRGQIAPIVLIPYPELLPDTSVVAAPRGCVVGISSEEASFLNDFVDTLNTSVELAAYTVRGEGRPVYVVPDVAQAFQPDHTVCEGGGESYAVYESFDKIGKGNIAAIYGVNNLLHPNANGHEAMARAISAWSNSRSASVRQVQGEVVWDPAIVTGPVSWADQTGRDIFYPDLTRTSPGAPVTATAEGYAPGIPVVLRLESSPTVLGTTVANSDGNVSLTVHTPRDVPMGSHHIVFYGFDSDGEVKSSATRLQVMQEGGQWLRLVAGGGLLLIIIGGVIGLFVRPRSSRKYSRG